MKKLWNLFEKCSPWIVAGFILLILLTPEDMIPAWAVLVSGLITGIAFFAMMNQQDKERRARIYQQGFEAGKKEAEKNAVDIRS